MNIMKFLFFAWLHRHAYIDLDGCLLQRMVMPGGMTMEQALVYWAANLGPTPIVRRRLVLCYMLRLLGVRLYVWTNRWPQHEGITRQALGRHAWLFSGMYFMQGKKSACVRNGPCMDDDKRWVGSRPGDLLVERE